MPKVTINEPVPFEGTEEQKSANFKTHHFVDCCGDYEYRCSQCDCKPWHKAASYPCGVEPPRRTVVYEQS